MDRIQLDFSSNLATPINFGLIENQKKYWATHFYSVLQCLRYHVNMRYPGKHFERMGNPDWTLAILRGDAEPNFFSNIIDYLNNWGLQYFIVNFLNSRRAAPLADDLIERIKDIYNVDTPHWLTEREFRMAGSDSALSSGLGLAFGRVFPQKLLDELPDKKKIIKNSDLCLILSEPGSETEKVGIFGEVEGVHGYKLSQADYYDTSKYYSIFSIGVYTEKGSGLYAENITLNGVTRIVYKFQADHHVARDFSYTLSWFHNLFHQTPRGRTECRDDDFNFLLNFIGENWHTPISEVLFRLRQFFDSDDTVNSFGVSPIITSLQAT
ncbi:hypothetical protein [Pseudomonas fragi]|uniref:hypothetical protein n=1 Tax=Pseudomonas fragi TaxID=296 RepID=UPI0039183F94